MSDKSRSLYAVTINWYISKQNNNIMNKVLTKDIAEETIETLRGGLESRVKELASKLMNADMTDEVLFAEYDVSSPVHTPNEDVNMASTISGLEVSTSGHLIFHIDSSYSDHDVLIIEITTENLVYILGELEDLTDHLD